MTYAIRGPRPTDQNYIASTWLRSLTRGRPRRSRDRRIGTTIDRVLDHASTALVVACKEVEPDAIVGWLCYATIPSTRLVHYIYVRDEHRAQGLARRLMAHAKLDDARPLVYTHAGPSTSWAAPKYNATHTPIQEILA